MFIMLGTIAGRVFLGHPVIRAGAPLDPELLVRVVGAPEHLFETRE